MKKKAKPNWNKVWKAYLSHAFDCREIVTYDHCLKIVEQEVERQLNETRL